MLNRSEIQKKASRGKERFVGCSGWLPTFTSGHLSARIPDNVDEDHVIALFAGRELADLKPSATKCSHIVPAYIGGRAKTCSEFISCSTREYLSYCFDRIPAFQERTSVEDGTP